MGVTIENPAILILGAILAAIPLKNKYQLIIIQKLVLLYLACVLINLVSDEYFTISTWRWSVNISYGISGVIFLSGMYFLKNNVITKKENRLYREILTSWLFALAIIVFHMGGLFLILKSFYGYGYEHDIKTIGALCSCIILFVCMWRGLSLRWVRLFSSISFAVGIGLISWGGLL